MPASRRQLRRAALATAATTAALAAATVILALSGPGRATAIALVALATSVLTLYWISRSLDADADGAVLGWLDQHGEGRIDQIAAGSALRPATVRLSLVRLARSRAVTASNDEQNPVYRLAG
ncbi:hypothetical protein OU787_25660 [Kitasatospora sp. YST-16]|uniref:hypothetical protein n=1 Tax=Kitasatospora sp. YST-16 TaxID=2998080 RepID=UPI002283B9B7|nr:hypothetical protein [Kitasatospora sp. YST-16]WAL74583.1 hypothetical protein OU787_25660 [Kitasatospora sp. YST-16]WNW40641.1 hypothetical protein RKE32_25595 [Streptomyces sp. Li-HN-5-13]